MDLRTLHTDTVKKISDRLSNLSPKWRVWLPSRGNAVFTLVVVAFLFVVQSAGAFGKITSSLMAEPSGSTGLIAYQGRLADTGGNPLTGMYTMVFRLYNQSTGGTPLWEEQRTGPNSVSISDGLFNVMLGSLTPIPQSTVESNTQLYLGVTVGNDDEMAPRVQIGSVLYARQALTVSDASVTTPKIADQAVNSAKIADKSVSTIDIADGAITSAKIADKSVSTIDIADGAITSVKIADGSIGTADILSGAITTATIANNAISSSKILDNTIATADLANGSVTTDKLAPGISSKITFFNEPILVLFTHSRSIPRTALDLSAYLPVTAKAVIISLGTNGKANIFTNGANAASLTAQDWGFNQGWVRLSNRFIDYQLSEGSTAGSDLYIEILGYVE